MIPTVGRLENRDLQVLLVFKYSKFSSSIASAMITAWLFPSVVVVTPRHVIYFNPAAFPPRGMCRIFSLLFSGSETELRKKSGNW
jgi:hypothetical protein